MQKKNLGELIDALASDASGRSETARLNDHMDHVEAALKKGISLSAIHELLENEGGFTMTFNSFKSALYRLRKKRRGGSSKRPKDAVKTTPQMTPKSEPEEDEVELPDLEDLSRKEKRQAKAQAYVESTEDQTSALDIIARAKKKRT